MAKVDNMAEVRRWSPTHEMAGSHLGQYILYSDHQQAIDALQAEVDALRSRLEDTTRDSLNNEARATRAEAEAAALRADAERLDWIASEARMLSGWRDTGRWGMPAIQIDSTRERCTPDDLRKAIDAEYQQAIDQARGKGVAE